MKLLSSGAEMLEGYSLLTNLLTFLQLFLTPANLGQGRLQVRADVSFQICFHSSVQTLELGNGRALVPAPTMWKGEPSSHSTASKVLLFLLVKQMPASEGIMCHRACWL